MIPRRTDAMGLTLVELLLATIVLVAAGVWLVGAYQSALQVTDMSRQAGIALGDLNDILERIKSTAFTQLATDFPNGAAGGAVGGGPDRYGAIVGGYTLANQQITVTHSPSTTADPRELIARVTWTSRNRTYQRQLSTVRSSQAS